MIGSYISLIILVNALVVYVLRFVSHLTNGRFLSSWKLVSNPPSKAELAFCYMAMILLLFGVIAKRLGWMS
jgi:hypothetical protein